MSTTPQDSHSPLPCSLPGQEGYPTAPLTPREQGSARPPHEGKGAPTAPPLTCKGARERPSGVLGAPLCTVCGNNLSGTTAQRTRRCSRLDAEHRAARDQGGAESAPPTHDQPTTKGSNP